MQSSLVLQDTKPLSTFRRGDLGRKTLELPQNILVESFSLLVFESLDQAFKLIHFLYPLGLGCFALFILSPGAHNFLCNLRVIRLNEFFYVLECQTLEISLVI